MKIINVFKQSVAAALVLAVISFAGCDKDTPDDGTVPANAMTMTTAIKGEVGIDFYLAGTGTATIYWGDGSAPETITLKSFAGEFGDAYRYAHDYSGTTSPTIAIDGQNITHLDCDDMVLTALDVSKNTALTYLNCGYNQLTSLDVSKNTALTYLYCDRNSLTSLDVSKNTALTDLDCCFNQLTDLDVSKNTALTDLDCSFNQLTNLNVSKNTVLTDLDCEGNQLTSLDVTKNTVLKRLDCSGNRFTAEGLNALFGTLPGNADSEIAIYRNPGIADCDISIARDKGWYVNH